MVKLLKLFMISLLIVSCSKKDENQKELSTLIFDNGTNQIVFNVEDAKNVEEMKVGLMFRDSIPEDGGMFFEIGEPRNIAMWMKDTKIPLDIIFINKNNEISGFIENAEPMTETVMPSPEPAIAVVEVTGGSVKKHDIQVGDTVRHPFLGNMPTESAKK